MRGLTGVFLSVSLFIFSPAVLSQTLGQGLGRTMTEDEISAKVFMVGPRGEHLPAGQGTARQGVAIYAQNCIFCHGPGGENGPQSALKGSPRYPFATSIWDYIHRAMPRSLTNVGVQNKKLTYDEVYALTAYILYINDIIGEDEVMDADSLPKVVIPIKTKY